MQKEGFFQMFQEILFPSYKLFSLTTLLLTFHLLIFIICVFHGGFDLKDKTDILPISQKALFYLGEKYTYFIVNEWEYWRILTNLFLTANITQLISVLITHLIVGSYFEKKQGFLQYLFLFLYSGISSTLLSAIFQDIPNVGGSFMCLSLFGCIFTMAFTYQLSEIRGSLRDNDWITKLEFPERFYKEFQYLLNALCIIDLLIGITNRNIDLMGNGLAILNGVFMGWIFMETKGKMWIMMKKISPPVILITEIIVLLFRNPNII